MTPEAVVEKYGITPRQVIDMKALMGDTSDNIPGVPGVGEKTAAKLLSQYQTLDNLYGHVGEIKGAVGKSWRPIKSWHICHTVWQRLRQMFLLKLLWKK